jgi:hypothetical protein
MDIMFHGDEQEQHKLRQIYIYNSEYIEARNKAKRLKWKPNHGADGKKNSDNGPRERPAEK